MTRYVDGFVIPVPKAKLAAYRRMARQGAKLWRKHGALDYKECVGDDLNAPMGLSFPKGIRTRPNETVVFSWIEFKSRAHRDRVNARVMKDPAIEAMANADAMPFDAARMLYGGFTVMVSA